MMLSQMVMICMFLTAVRADLPLDGQLGPPVPPGPQAPPDPPRLCKLTLAKFLWKKIIRG